MALRISGERFGHAETILDSSKQSYPEICEAPREAGGSSVAPFPSDSTSSISLCGPSSPVASARQRKDPAGPRPVRLEKGRQVWVVSSAKMVDEKRGLRPDLTNDGVHPTIAGFTVMAPWPSTQSTRH